VGLRFLFARQKESLAKKKLLQKIIKKTLLVPKLQLGNALDTRSSSFDGCGNHVKESFAKKKLFLRGSVSTYS